MQHILLPLLILFVFLSPPLYGAGAEHRCELIGDENLRLIDKDTEFHTTLPSGEPIVITRQLTECAKNLGWIQPLAPVPGIQPATELDVLDAIGNPDILLIDMRTPVWFTQRTIPGAINVPYTEIAFRLDEFGCNYDSAVPDCSGAKTVLGFCNGPVCPQSPIGMKAMVDEGFPAEKIMYYRGGMLDWDALGLTTVAGEPRPE